tara:strand:+ start:261 stop:485 length:225 start_codon:yes stop_codon:yes gene_type:complete
MKNRWIQKTIKKFRDTNKRKAKELERLLSELEDFVSIEFDRSSKAVKENLLEITPDDQLFFDMFLSRIRGASQE